LKNKEKSTEPKTLGAFKFWFQSIIIIIITLGAGCYIGWHNSGSNGLVIGALLGEIIAGILCIFNTLRLIRIKK